MVISIVLIDLLVFQTPPYSAATTTPYPTPVDRESGMAPLPGWSRWWDPVHAHSQVQSPGEPRPVDLSWPCPEGSRRSLVSGRCSPIELHDPTPTASPINIERVHDGFHRVLDFVDAYLPGAGTLSVT